jgi:hypothetical protein
MTVNIELPSDIEADVIARARAHDPKGGLE